ncbi:HNH/ENDO VII family nuclease [Selenomonas massiliensis]|uniref:HNH/ENDO VII family nuclease n=1 Tax=Selenomonas massiliensis TaxID=2058293 RepID=UPI000D100660|nr:HNH/ENDO VII family nuclease [Selenomonas massiliensis]
MVQEIAAAIAEKGRVVAEAAKKDIESWGKRLDNIHIHEERGPLAEKMEDIRTLSPEQLQLRMEKILRQGEYEAPSETKGEIRSLTDEEKQRIKDETGWSDEIVDAIGSMEEYEIYKKAGLVEAEVDGKKCLVRTDINWDQVDEKGRTNRERVERGLSPLDENGKPIELHHIGQHADSPLAELTFEEHRCNGNDTILHNKGVETEVHGEGSTWNQERADHWKDRATQ